MNKTLGLLGVVAAGMVMVGCHGSSQPSKEQVEAQRAQLRLIEAQSERDQLKPQVAELQQQLEAAKADALAKDKTISKLQNDLIRAGDTVSSNQEANKKSIDKLTAEVASLTVENTQLKAKIADLEAKLAAPAPAPKPELNK